ncbi:MAG: type II toxin-antitoxin system mRNA interferase toxin, RelE/StbE family [Deltaproteobacteria bacterium]|nr:type II toxin-antitoxin system mRNA interferase toxin, RelE/StbE family [Deltaproteobacteria bacterium]
MRKFTIVTTSAFLRQAKVFFRKHPELKKKFSVIVEELQKDPFLPRLQLHPLKGKLKGLYSVSITRSYRLTLTLEIREHEIILIDIGSHDEVYR